MLETLPLFHRLSGQPVVVLGEGEAALAKRRLVERAGGIVVSDLEQGATQGARLAFIALEADAAAQEAVAYAHQLGFLVNATDRPTLCDFTVPSILDRSPVIVAVGTGGASAGLAKQLRLRLEAILPQSLGHLAKGLAAVRAPLRARFAGAVERRQVLDAALAPYGPLDPLQEHGPEAVTQWWEHANLPQASVAHITLRSDDPDDLTLREARWLGTADRIVYQGVVPQSIWDRARADAVRVPEGEYDPAFALSGVTVLLRKAA